jgi:hypothetical protein
MFLLFCDDDDGGGGGGGLQQVQTSYKVCVYREALFITALPSTKYAVYIFDHRLQSYI